MPTKRSLHTERPPELSTRGEHRQGSLASHTIVQGIVEAAVPIASRSAVTTHPTRPDRSERRSPRRRDVRTHSAHARDIDGSISATSPTAPVPRIQSTTTP